VGSVDAASEFRVDAAWSLQRGRCSSPRWCRDAPCTRSGWARARDAIELDLVDETSRTYVVTKVLPKVHGMPWSPWSRRRPSIWRSRRRPRTVRRRRASSSSPSGHR